MIDNVKVINQYTEAEIELGRTLGHSYLIETDGLSWGDTDATHSSYVNLTGVGDIITSTKLESREISITGRVCSPHTNKEIAQLYEVTTIREIKQKKIEEIEQAKVLLSQIVNPTHFLRLFCGDYFIDGKPKASVNFSKNWKENNEVYCKFSFTILCNDPLFHYKKASETPLSGTYHGFHFPLIIKKPRGMHFGQKISYQLLNVNNSGDVTLGGVIYIKARGTVTNPEFTNVYTQEFVRINKTLEENEVIAVDTVNHTVKGAVDGENFENYFRYWDFDNTWFQFDIGDTLFGFSAEGETFRNMDVWIELNKSYFSMENQ